MSLPESRPDSGIGTPFHTQASLISSNPRSIELGIWIMKIVSDHDMTPRFIYDQLALGGRLLSRDTFTISCRTKVHLHTQKSRKQTDKNHTHTHSHKFDTVVV